MERLETKIDDSWWRVERLPTPHKDFKVEMHIKGFGWSVIAGFATLRDDNTLFNDASLDNETFECVEAAIQAYLNHESRIASFVPGCDPDRRLDQRVMEALDLLGRYGQIDGSHHKMWCIDQVVRLLTDDSYDEFIAWSCNGEDGPDTYDWDEGIPP